MVTLARRHLGSGLVRRTPGRQERRSINPLYRDGASSSPHSSRLCNAPEISLRRA